MSFPSEQGLSPCCTFLGHNHSSPVRGLVEESRGLEILQGEFQVPVAYHQHCESATSSIGKQDVGGEGHEMGMWQANRGTVNDLDRRVLMVFDRPVIGSNGFTTL